MRKNLTQYTIYNLNNNLFKIFNRTYVSLHFVDRLEAQFLE